MYSKKYRIFLCSILISILFLFLTAVDLGSGQAEGTLFKHLVWRNIGPANMGGRISDIQALDDDFRYVITASASGGVWKSVNAGTTWEPIFDTYGSASIGAVAIFQKDPNIIWVGTGEANVRNSVGWGDGIYRSNDGGKTFTNLGLEDSHHIARIVTHPTDPDIVYVASQGHLWGHTGERGLFKTTDGGKTWKKLMNGTPDDGKTGCTDIKMNPKNPDILYTAFWERLRRPYRFDSGGPNSGIFKSTDGGNTWRKLTKGLAEGDIGRIGLSIYYRNPEIVMAIVEHGFQPRRGTKDYDDMKKLGTGVYRSEDGGENWKYMNRYNNRPFYYSQIYINPLDDKLVYAMGTRAQVSEDGGKTFSSGMPGIAGDFHAMWLDPYNKDRYYVGNDKGISLTHDHGERFNFFDNFVISQIYAVSVDLRDPYYVYIGLQDNGVWGGPSNSRDYNGIFNDHWFKFHSGDGFYTAVDPTDWTTVYSERQRGRIRRNHALFRQMAAEIAPNKNNTINWDEVVPQQTDEDRPVVRMNWNTPFVISHHNPRTLYYGGNFLFKSVDRGNHWKIISPDLSTNDPVKTNRESGGLTRDVTGAETHCTIVTISESALMPGLIWVGTDDGNIQLTKEEGESWENVSPNVLGVPEGLWVSRVEASHFDKKTCYVTFDGHRSDVFKPYVFRTTDYGQTWENITNNLPDGHCTYVIKEDLKNKNLLFVGTEFGAFVSVNGGKTWTRLMNGMPTVAVHDLLIHPRDNDLIAGTHGRGVWILDDITPLQQLSPEILESEAYLFESPIATEWEGISRGATRGHQLFIGRNPLSMSQVEPSNSPSQIQNTATISYYLKKKPENKPELEVSILGGKGKLATTIDDSAGINRYRWNMRFNPSEQQKKSFLQRMEDIFKQLKEQVSREQKRRLEQLYKEFKKAKTPDDFNRVREQLIEEFGQFARGRGFFFRPLQGPLAGPGIYQVKLVVDGETYTQILKIRKDPMLD
ncbi:MAG: hypothetical protein JSV96_04875 [Candidatus Aminicenantes bacterium]|nr:MAG: hypothetical protein JSV96_04875 [Candidatus Aminicenantes bacterium]